MRYYHLLPVFFLALIFTTPAHATIMNGSTHKVYMVVDTVGGSANNSDGSYNAKFSVHNAQGFANGTSQRVCLGFYCLEYSAVSSVITVSFLLDFSINGTASDVAYVSTNTTVRRYAPGDITKYYGCVEDSSVNATPAFGIAFAGSKLTYIELGNVSGRYSIRMAQEEPDNLFVLPVTINNCNSVGNKMPLTVPFTPFVSFSDALNAIELSVSYPIDLIGNLESTGRFTLALEKNDTSTIIGAIG